MRSGYLLAAVLFCLSAGPLLRLQAQFTEPTKEEFQMTEDPKWPGAHAIGLNVEEYTDDVKHSKMYYSRIKVLTEKGKERGTVRMMFVRGGATLAGFEGRTIHPDGTIATLSEPPSEFTEVKIKRLEIASIVFTLPSVTVGSILEYRVKFVLPKKEFSAPTWELQHEYPVRKARYSFLAKKLDFDTGGYFLQYDGRIPKTANVLGDLKTSYLLELTDIPPLPDEDWMAPVNNISWRVQFYYSDGVTGRSVWDHVRAQWADYVRAVVEPTKDMKRIAAGLVAASDSNEEKAKKLYAAVQKLDNTDFSRVKSKSERKVSKVRAPKTLADVWLQKSGSRDQLALLYVSLARAAGLDVFPAQVVNRDTALFDYQDPSDSQLEDYIAIVFRNDHEVFLDPGEKLCPFGMLHWKHTDATGFRLTNGTPINFTTPKATYSQTMIQRTASLSAKADGSVSGTIRISMSGSEALDWRQTALENDLDEVKKQFNEDMQESLPAGIHSEVDHFLGLDDSDSNLIAQVNISGTLGSVTSKRLILPLVIVDSWRGHHFVSQQKRITAIDMQYPRAEEDVVYYWPPEGFAIESSPQPADAIWPALAALRIRQSTTEGVTTVNRSFVYTFTGLPAWQYAGLYDFFQKVAAADQQQLVFTKVASLNRGSGGGVPPAAPK
jgi:hypothetical protein